MLTDSLSAVTVTADKGMTVSRSDTIKVVAGATVSEVLMHNPGLHVMDNGGVAGLKTVSLRGMGSAHTSIYIDGVRVVCSFSEDVYAIADALLKQDDIELITQKDYIAVPKPNGYRSLHLIVAVPVYLSGGKRMTKVEVQLRTIAMDWWASLEHQLRYKKDTVFSEEMARELHECAEISARLDARMDTLRKRIMGESAIPNEIG